MILTVFTPRQIKTILVTVWFPCHECLSGLYLDTHCLKGDRCYWYLNQFSSGISGQTDVLTFMRYIHIWWWIFSVCNSSVGYFCYSIIYTIWRINKLYYYHTLSCLRIHYTCNIVLLSLDKYFLLKCVLLPEWCYFYN